MVKCAALGIVGLVAGAIATAPSAQAQTRELKVSLYLPASNVMNQEVEAFGRELKEKSQGRLTLNLFHGGQMGPLQRQYDLVRTGVADMSYVLHGATPGRFPMMELA